MYKKIHWRQRKRKTDRSDKPKSQPYVQALSFIYTKLPTEDASLIQNHLDPRMKKQLPRLLILAAIIIAAFYLHDHSFSSQAPSGSPEKSTKASDRTVFVRTIPLRDKPRSPRSTGGTVENQITATSIGIQSTQVSNEIQIETEQITNNFDLTTTPHPANMRETTHFQESVVSASSQRQIHSLPPPQ